MDNNGFNPEQLAHKWLAGTLTPQEQAWFEQWYDDFNDEELLLSESKYTSADQIGAAILSSLNAQIDKEPKSPVKVVHLWRRIAVAAAVVLAIGLGAFYRVPLLNLVDPVKQVQLATAPGQHHQIDLPDGTRVWLSPSSTISYPETFRNKQRNVSIEGETYFEVVHDKNHPFVIQSGAIKTVVLGTSFDVKAYSKAASVEVTVVSGKVGVSANTVKQPEMVTANQRTVYQKATAHLVTENYPDAIKFLSQRNGIFDFKGASLQEVCSELETQYGIRISLAPGLTAKAFYGRLQTTGPLSRTLDKLCAVMETRWEKQGETYLLHL